MANIKLTEHNWEASGVYDITQTKTQRQINADVQTALNGKQAALTFDDSPIANSPNPVKSSGIKDAIDRKYTKPGTGIPKTDLSSDVQASLDLADSALQTHQSLAAYRTSADQDAIDATKYVKPSGGIPKTDLASAVQTSLGLADNAKQKQSAVSDPSASGTGVTFIATLSQDSNGVITPTKQTVRDVTTSVNGLMIASDKAKLDYIGTGSNAGFHNSIYRGKNLGTSVTAAQYAQISAGTFDDLFIGDYWVINSVNWRIAAFDYWLNCGDTACTTHHVVIVPDTSLATKQMHNTESGKYTEGAANNPTTGAYVGSDMYTTNLAAVKTTINNAFGSAHILTHREYLKNAAPSGYETAGAWYDSTVELMTEQMVYGGKVFANCMMAGNWAAQYTIDKSQLPLFHLEPSRVCIRATWWLRDVASSALFASVSSAGLAYASNSSSPFGVRPAFGIKA